MWPIDTRTCSAAEAAPRLGPHRAAGGGRESALDAPGPVAPDETLHLRDRDVIEVAGDRVLQARGRGCELDRVTLLHAGQQREDQGARERVARAHAIDDRL